MSDAAPRPDAPQPSLLRFAPLLVFAALGVVFAYMLFNNSGGTLPSALIGKPAPSFSLPLLDRGETPAESGLAAEGAFATADLRSGAVSVVNLWASWCAPCRLEHPQLMALAEQGVPIYGVAFQDKPAASRAFLEELGDPFVKVGVDANGQAGLRWGVEGVPETFILDGEGRVVLKHTGDISAEELRSVILPAIAEARRR